MKLHGLRKTESSPPWFCFDMRQSATAISKLWLPLWAAARQLWPTGHDISWFFSYESPIKMNSSANIQLPFISMRLCSKLYPILIHGGCICIFCQVSWTSPIYYTVIIKRNSPIQSFKCGWGSGNNIWNYLIHFSFCYRVIRLEQWCSKDVYFSCESLIKYFFKKTIILKNTKNSFATCLLA